MSDQNTAAADQGTQAQADGATADTTAKLYATRAEAEANKPADLGKKRLYCVTRPDGRTCWLWSDGYARAAHAVARADGYAVSLGGKVAPVTKESVAAKLAEFTDDELAALGLSRKLAKGGKKN
jgi:hypothetical protein